MNTACVKTGGKIVLIILWIVAALQIKAQQHAVILHSNDLHSQMEPIASGDNAGLGGMTRIAAIAEEVRSQSPAVFLFDAGDFWTGTPYFNFYGGKVAIDMMNAMDYDVVTLGNHQFDVPLNVLAQRLSEAEFEVVLSNYNMKATPIKNFVKPYTIVEKQGIRIGVTGVCVDLEGVAMKENTEGMIYKDPVKAANKAARRLKRQGCDLIVCLSHLGYREGFLMDDVYLAENSKNIDVIIGGHTHTFLEEPDSVPNKRGEPVVIVQMGKSGAYLGRMDVYIVHKK